MYSCVCFTGDRIKPWQDNLSERSQKNLNCFQTFGYLTVSGIYPISQHRYRIYPASWGKSSSFCFCEGILWSTVIFPVFWADPKRLLLWWSESHRKCNYLIFLRLILHFAGTRFWAHSQQVARPGCEPSFIQSSGATFKAATPGLRVSDCFAFLLRQPSSDGLVSESLSFLILLNSLVVLTPYRYHVRVCVCVCV